jgi:hypothetical protein
MKFVPLLRLFLLLSALCSLGTSLRVDITDAHNGGTPSTIDTGVRDLHSTQSIVDVQKSISPFCPPMFRHQAAISHYSFKRFCLILPDVIHWIQLSTYMQMLY